MTDPLTQISPNQWQYQGKQKQTVITYELTGLFHRYTVPGTDTNFGTLAEAATWIAKQENQAERNANHGPL